MYQKLLVAVQRPALYEKTPVRIWEDDHIAQQMLQAHLNPHTDGATRNHGFVTQSAGWIGALCPPKDYPRLVDFGCGPGIYGNLFSNSGYVVTGLDINPHAVCYAKGKAKEQGHGADYRVADYLTVELEEQYDIATLIWCDYGALDLEERKTLLQNIFRTLRPGGVLLLDVFTQHAMDGMESTRYAYQEEGGFWSPLPHLVMEATHWYTGGVLCRQAVIVTEEQIAQYNIWEHYFSEEELVGELAAAGFTIEGLYGDVAGAHYEETSPILCALAKKG
ncbi:methyltransferase domain-containing protein [Eubacteriales bacterium OttesenSCG-928-M02]|nr:methyltransferase domain-containing protein [Eubacteriales bacterium OttesenSCG-928-M02]